MSVLLIRLEGPMQAWGTQSRFGERDTDLDPSKSGVVGFLGAALGIRRTDTPSIARLAELPMAVRVDREGVLSRDYQTAGGGSWNGERYGVYKASGAPPDTAISNRFFLADASFLVALGCADEAHAQQIVTALGNPVWPLFLGRKGYVPSVPPLVAIQHGAVTPEEALRGHPWRRARREPPERIRLVVECAPGEGRARSDVPLSFDPRDRRYGVRHVRTDWIRTEDLAEEPNKEGGCISPDSF